MQVHFARIAVLASLFRAPILAAALLAALVLPVAAKAATITETVSFTATYFTSVQGTTPPVDPVIGSFEVTFDPTLFTYDATTISINNLNINLGSPISFNYNPMVSIMTIGGSDLGSGGFFWGSDDFSLAMKRNGAGLYSFEDFHYTQAGIDPDVFDAHSSPVAPTVPIPGSLLLLATALTALGCARWGRVVSGNFKLEETVPRHGCGFKD